MQKSLPEARLCARPGINLLISAKDFATVDYFMRKGFVRDKETAMPNRTKDGDTPEEMGYIHPKTGVFMKSIPGCSAQNPLPMVI